MPKSIRVLLGEPLLIFLLLGGVICVVVLKIKPAAEETELIRVEAETIGALVRNSELLQGRPVTDEERRQLIEGFIEDEVLMREAASQGLHMTDGRVRKRLLGVMRYGTLTNVPEPSRQQLEAYYNEKREQYRSSPAVSLEHVFFDWESKKQPSDPEAFRAGLAASEDPVSLGDPFFPSNTARRSTRRDLLGTFGPGFADAVAGIEAGDEWHGPIESDRGRHFVRVLERHPPTLPSFEDLENYLRQDWMMTKTMEGRQKNIDAMRKRYRVEIEEENGGGK